MPLRRTAFVLATLMAFAGPADAQTHYLAEPSGAQLAAADVLLVDIRQPQEWQQTGVLPGALLIAHNGDPAAFLAALEPHLDGRPVALICRTGSRTAQAAAALAPALDVPVIDIAGGMLRLIGEGTRTAAPTPDMGCTVC
ncbi:MAG: rhodanese-like domain-containing protein [Alkalilacustris sp.]